MNVSFENLIKECCNDFFDAPFNIFNERDAITLFTCKLKEKRPGLFQPCKTLQRHKISLFHQEYRNPWSKDSEKLDAVILNKEYITSNNIDVYHLTRPELEKRPLPSQSRTLFDVVFEFKFLYEAPGRNKAIEKDFMKLVAALPYTKEAYFIFFQRLLKNSKTEKIISNIERLRKTHDKKKRIRAYIAVADCTGENRTSTKEPVFRPIPY